MLVTEIKDSRRVVFTAAAAAAAVVAWSINRRRKHSKLAQYQKIDLLPNEVGFVICSSPACSSITFFEGNTEDAKLYFSRRTNEIVTANPWLGGFLDYGTDNKLALFVPPKSTPQNNPFAVLDIPLSRHYHTMVESLGSALCGTTQETVGAEDQPLWKVTLVPNGPHKFALIVSANHSILDGHGYYRMYNMLSNDQPIVSLSPYRKHELSNKIVTAMGNEQSIMSSSPPGFLFRFLTSVLRNSLYPATKTFGFTISKDWIREQKKQSIDVPFVSTNDVLVSKFCNTLQCDLAIMAINFRGRIDGCTDDDVGNYEDLLSYTKDDYVTPSLIRKSVSGPYRRAGNGKMPSNWEHATRGTYAAITNWATFARDIQVGGVKDAAARPTKQLIHVPLFDFPKATPACTFGSMVMFKPKEGDVAVLIGGKQELIDKIKLSGMVGEPLDMEF